MSSSLVPYQDQIRAEDTNVVYIKGGSYWRALKDMPEQVVSKDDVLMVLSVRYVDNEPHTVILLPHPLKLNTKQEIKFIDEDGREVTQYTNLNEHRFLAADFVNNFKEELDYKRIRAKEIEKLTTTQ